MYPDGDAASATTWKCARNAADRDVARDAAGKGARGGSHAAGERPGVAREWRRGRAPAFVQGLREKIVAAVTPRR
jgi:hypothetical protein